jgi:hypothetical protein
MGQAGGKSAFCARQGAAPGKSLNADISACFTQPQDCPFIKAA